MNGAASGWTPLAERDFAALQPLLAAVDAGAEIAAAVLSGHTRGRVFVDAWPRPRAAFFHDHGFSVLAGAADAAFARSALAWAMEHGGQDFFILYPGHAGWTAVVDSVADASVRKVPRIAYRFDSEVFAARPAVPPLPSGFELVRMDAALMRAAANTLYPWLRGTWISEERFERDGLGFCVLAQGSITSLCYSIFAGGTQREIDILTAAPYRRLGLARAAAAAYLRACLAQRLEPGWNCYEENEGSRELGESLGFVPAARFPVHAWQRAR